MIVVIPSNRAIDLGYLSPLIEAGARFIVVDDSEGTIAVDHPSFEVFNWNDRRRILGPLDEHFPRRNGACRDFGFLMAWRQSDAGEIVVALDDDCRVYHEDFAERVEAALSPALRPVASVAGRHLNILDLYAGPASGLYPRGFPYSARVAPQRLTFDGRSEEAPLFSLGLWKDIYDVNAVDKVAGRQYRFPDAELNHASVAVAPGKLVSVCSMNMQFRREVLPAAYQLPMHVPVLPDGVIDRYGDIWGGFILKVLMDLRGDTLAVGEPMIRHLKEGDYVRNIWQENLCHQVNDEFLDLLWAAAEPLVAASYLDMMAALTDGFAQSAARCSPILKAYLARLVPSLKAWTAALAVSS